MLQSASAFGSQGAGKDYSILRSAGGSGVVVSWGGLDESPVTLGDRPEYDAELIYLLDAFVKTNSRQTHLATVAATVDTIRNVLKNDPQIQGTCERVISISAAREPDAAYTFGGVDWLRIPVEVGIMEYA